MVFYAACDASGMAYLRNLGELYLTTERVHMAYRCHCECHGSWNTRWRAHDGSPAPEHAKKG